MTGELKPLTDEELDALEEELDALEVATDHMADLTDTQDAPSAHATHRLVAEVRRLRADGWIDAAAEEIVDELIPDLRPGASQTATLVAAIIRKHLERA